MITQRELIAAALRELPLYTLLEDADDQNSIEDDVAARLVARGDIVSTRLPDEAGCGFWLPSDGETIEAVPAEWWSCAIPDAEHHGRDHVLVRRVRGGARG